MDIQPSQLPDMHKRGDVLSTINRHPSSQTLDNMQPVGEDQRRGSLAARTYTGDKSRRDESRVQERIFFDRRLDDSVGYGVGKTLREGEDIIDISYVVPGACFRIAVGGIPDQSRAGGSNVELRVVGRDGRGEGGQQDADVLFVRYVWAGVFSRDTVHITSVSIPTLYCAPACISLERVAYL